MVTASLNSGSTKDCGCNLSNLDKYVGRRVGSLEVLYGVRDHAEKIRWISLCTCGGVKKLYSHEVKAGKVTHCGCASPYSEPLMVGKRYGKLRVVKQILNHNKLYTEKYVWLCKCVCGQDREVPTSRLTGGEIASCKSCYKSKRENLSGQVFGELTVVKDTGEKDKWGNPWWLCKCSCGGSSEVRHSCLTSRTTSSCGCRANLGKHNDSFSTEYRTWSSMRSRCQSPNHPSYPHYGGRGIKVCDRWQEYSNFLEDMGRRPKKGLSLDRIDNNGNYEPNNCRWADVYTQNRNQRVRKGNKSGVAGVTWNNRRGLWLVTFGTEGRTLNLGVFEYDRLEEAIRIRKEAELKYWGRTYDY